MPKFVVMKVTLQPTVLVFENDKPIGEAAPSPIDWYVGQRFDMDEYLEAVEKSAAERPEILKLVQEKFTILPEKQADGK